MRPPLWFACLEAPLSRKGYTCSALPQRFTFLSLDDFNKLTSHQRQAYLKELALYIASLNIELDEYDKRKDDPQAPMP